MENGYLLYITDLDRYIHYHVPWDFTFTTTNLAHAYTFTTLAAAGHEARRIAKQHKTTVQVLTTMGISLSSFYPG